MSHLVTRVQNTYSKVLGTGDSVEETKEIPNHGDIVALDLQFSLTVAGAITAARLEKILKKFKLTNKGNATVFDLEGTEEDIYRLAYWMNAPPVGKGLVNRSTNVNAAAVFTWNVRIPYYAKQGEGPFKLDLTWGAYTTFGAGVTSGSVTLTVTVEYAPPQDGLTFGLKQVNAVMPASGTEKLNPKIPKGLDVARLLLSFVADANISTIKFARENDIEAEDINVTHFADKEDLIYYSGHQAGMLDLLLSPFRSDDKTVLDIKSGGAHTLRMYFLYAMR